MRIKHWISLFIFTLAATNLSAQGKSLTLEDLIPGGKTYTRFIPQTEYRIQWMGDNLIFTDTTTLYLVNPRTPSEMTTNLMLRHPETFKVGVAGGPVRTESICTKKLRDILMIF